MTIPYVPVVDPIDDATYNPLDSGVTGITDPGLLRGRARIVMGASGELIGQKLLAGAASMVMTAAAEMTVEVHLAGSSSMSMGAAGDLVDNQFLEGSASMAMNTTGSILGNQLLQGSASMVMNASGDLDTIHHLAGAASMAMDAAGEIEVTVEIAGAASMEMGAAGALDAEFPAGYAHKVAITIDSDDIDATLSYWTLVFDQSFASVLTQVNGPLDADGTRASLNGGGDIRFSSDSAGSTRLACDIRDWTTSNTPANATCEVAVKIPSVSNSEDTTIYMWWGKSGESQPSVSDTFGQYNAYDEYYAFVSPCGGDCDRIDNDGTFTENGGVDPGGIAGEVGDATYFDGTDDYIVYSRNVAVGATDFTFESIAKPRSGNQSSAWASEFLPTGNQRSWVITTATGGYLRLAATSDGVSNSYYIANTTDMVTDGNWHHAAVILDGGNSVSMIVDGVTQTFGTYDAPISNLFNSSAEFTLAAIRSGGALGDVSLDETRISLTNRSAAWIKADYNNLFNTSGFLTWGSIVDN